MKRSRVGRSMGPPVERRYGSSKAHASNMLPTDSLVA
jgi:hypothetical protein